MLLLLASNFINDVIVFLDIHKHGKTLPRTRTKQNYRGKKIFCIVSWLANNKLLTT